MKIGRNDACWCGSGQKYKRCHMQMDERIEHYRALGHEVPGRELIKTPEQIARIKESAAVNNGLLDYITPFVKAGISTGEIDRLVEEYTRGAGAVPAPLHYNGFPKSVCTSLNSEVCHGIPSSDVVLKEGDIINVDVSTILDGYFSDASRMFMIGEVSDAAQRLVQVAKECVEVGIAALKPWGFMGDMGEAVHEHALKNGYSVVREIGGHGVGLEFHEEPFVSYVSKRGAEMLLVPGMMFTVEPMVNEGTDRVVTDEKNGWTVYTADGKLSAQWESMVLITEDGVEILSC
ncbi:methionyl aminopeptidase [Gehongia tenuis]|uniref:Methionine aminopeptidase n=1 Tax=Gehongia tenuis TaxID=2763655 RepID=A0A926HQG8_9FIRM|nr:methionyl aminopeptidase [Gehongia tenuis]MBC8531725.1 methionyl aminopeptidase [Gehongia tenuis]